MSSLQQYMIQRNVDPLLMIQVRRYMEYLHKEEEKDNENCLILIDKLNSDLHKEV